MNIEQTASFLLEKTKLTRKEFHSAVAVVLGSGLGGFAENLKSFFTIRFSDIPGFLPTSIPGHEGKLIFGKISDTLVVVLQGRLHLYEGHALTQVVFPMRVLKSLGIQAVVITNSSGGINPSFRSGDLMLITDHINLTGTNPLVGPNLDHLGPRFVDLSNAYDKEFQEILKKSATHCNIQLRQGVYAGLLGPSYETPAEVHMLHTLGADAVGMSTVSEVIAANHCHMRVCAIACIANLAAGIAHENLTHEQVVLSAKEASKKLSTLLIECIPQISIGSNNAG